MTNESVYAWSERENRMVVIGTYTWNGRDELLPSRAQKSDVRMYQRGKSHASEQLPTQAEIGDVHNCGPAVKERPKCLGCGKLIPRGCRRCVACQRAGRTLREART